jgi:hypothetical protein
VPPATLPPPPHLTLFFLSPPRPPRFAPFPGDSPRFNPFQAFPRLSAGYISDPVSKAKSVVLTDDGAKRSEALFEKLFGKQD